ncbi:hypothetical protein F4823DRAFT_204804 [Ustulina deusta]|nr:hypothetical protein F4823DRAFT_204804 [Ustulina deusta]
MAPYTPSIPRARGTRGARNEPSSAHDRGAGEGRGSRGVDVKLGQELATRETEKERVIVLDSDSDSDSDDSDDDGAGSSPEPAPPSLPHSSLGSSARTVEVGDRTTRATAELPTPRRRFSGLWDLGELKTPTNKTTGLAPRQSASSAKDKNSESRRFLDTPSIPASSRSLDSTYPPKPLFGEAGDVEDNKKNVKFSGTSRQQPATTASSTSTTTAHQKSTLPRNSSSILPPTLFPAVKSRVYSTPRPAVQRDINNESKKLEAFGFVSAASLVAGAATPTTRNAAVVTPTPTFKSNSLSHSVAKPVNQCGSGQGEPAQAQSRKHQSLPRTTQNTPAAVTPVPIVEAKPISKPTRRGTIQGQTSSLQPLPRTPENPMAAKQAPTSSVGSYHDPYAISSDSDSDSDSDDEDSNGKPHNIPSLKSLSSFAEPADAHETASDVEAVLNQFPVWLNSPSPTELGSSYLAASTPPRPTIDVRPIATTRPSKRSYEDEDEDDDGGKTKDKEGKEQRRVRFRRGDDGSPSPTKRAAISDESRRPPARRIPPPPPPSSFFSSASIEGIAAPSRKTTALGADPHSNRHPRTSPDRNHNQGHPLRRGKSAPIKEEEEEGEEGRSGKETKKKKKKKKKRKKKKGRPSGDNKTACRHRNRNRRREIGRPGETLAGGLV